MFRNSKDDGQLFLMVIGAGARNDANEGGELGGLLVGILAIAIVLMVFVGLLNEREHRRSQQLLQPIVPERYFRPTSWPDGY